MLNDIQHAQPNIELTRDAFGRLTLTDADGRTHEGVSVVRAFPITDPQHWVAIVDAHGHELALVANLDAVPAHLRAILEEELAGREFLPEIRRIVKVSGRIEPCAWDIETDRGPRTFVLNAYEDVHRLANHRALIVDAEGVRYLVPDIRALDPVSRRHLERYL
jgi:hypothetical protein